jgi:hypothetical protein
LLESVLDADASVKSCLRHAVIGALPAAYGLKTKLETAAGVKEVDPPKASGAAAGK